MTVYLMLATPPGSGETWFHYSNRCTLHVQWHTVQLSE